MDSPERVERSWIIRPEKADGPREWKGQSQDRRLKDLLRTAIESNKEEKEKVGRRWKTCLGRASGVGFGCTHSGLTHSRAHSLSLSLTLAHSLSRSGFGIGKPVKKELTG